MFKLFKGKQPEDPETKFYDVIRKHEYFHGWTDSEIRAWIRRNPDLVKKAIETVSKNPE